jgi:flagellar assembly protein FliH
MSSSSSGAASRGTRVLRGTDTRCTPSTDALGLDLGADALRRLDPKRVEEAVAEGRATGYAQGWQAGVVAGQTAAAAELAGVREQLALVVARAAQSLEANLERVDAAWTDVTTQATSLAYAVVEALLGRELAVAVDPGADAVRRALASVPGGADLVLRLHPDDAAALATDALPGDRECTVVTDPTLARGDCVAEASATRVDARIASALDRVRAVLGVTE